MKKIFSQTYGQGPELVLLHGWGVNSAIWQGIAPLLAKDFRVTLIDLPGFGQSCSVTDYSLPAIIDKIQQVTPPQAIWLGWSLGGLIATQIALLYPNQVSHLICVASTPKFIKTANWPGVDNAVLEKFANQLTQNYALTLKHFLLLQFHGIPLNKKKLQQLQQQLFSQGTPNLAALQAGLAILQTLDLRDALTKLTCPALYVLGQLDLLVPACLETLLPRLGRIDTTIIAKASHAVFLSHPELFISRLKAFYYEYH